MFWRQYAVTYQKIIFRRLQFYPNRKQACLVVSGLPFRLAKEDLWRIIPVKKYWRRYVEKIWSCWTSEKEKNLIKCLPVSEEDPESQKHAERISSDVQKDRRGDPLLHNWVHQRHELRTKRGAQVLHGYQKLRALLRSALQPPLSRRNSIKLLILIPSWTLYFLYYQISISPLNIIYYVSGSSFQIV